jgi:hypothetical protein
MGSKGSKQKNTKYQDQYADYDLQLGYYSDDCCQETYYVCEVSLFKKDFLNFFIFQGNELIALINILSRTIMPIREHVVILIKMYSLKIYVFDSLAPFIHNIHLIQ